jgi:hypothetical protein
LRSEHVTIGKGTPFFYLTTERTNSMKQTNKTGTASSVHTNIRLDPLAKAKLDWLISFYASQGENLSVSIILRRAIEVLENRAAQFSGGKYKAELEAELMMILSCCVNKPCPFNGNYPWKNLGDRPLRTFAHYVPSPLMARLWADRSPIRSGKATNN